MSIIFFSYSEMENEGTLDLGNNADIYCLDLTLSLCHLLDDQEFNLLMTNFDPDYPVSTTGIENV